MSWLGRNELVRLLVIEGSSGIEEVEENEYFNHKKLLAVC